MKTINDYRIDVRIAKAKLAASPHSSKYTDELALAEDYLKFRQLEVADIAELIYAYRKTYSFDIGMAGHYIDKYGSKSRAWIMHFFDYKYENDRSQHTLDIEAEAYADVKEGLGI